MTADRLALGELAQLARDVPDLSPGEFRRRLIEACGGDEAAAERLAGMVVRRLTPPHPPGGPQGQRH